MTPNERFGVWHLVGDRPGTGYGATWRAVRGAGHDAVLAHGGEDPGRGELARDVFTGRMPHGGGTCPTAGAMGGGADGPSWRSTRIDRGGRTRYGRRRPRVGMVSSPRRRTRQ